MGKQKLSVLTITRAAAAELLYGQLVDATGAVATAAGNAMGAAVTDAASGDNFPLDVLGTTTLIADGAVTDGMELEVGTGGAATELDTGVKVAVALEDAADGGYFEALLIPINRPY